jgi:alanine-glyoxylate transaminase/serine-glyoxylate transaminase/serine-pyruvate transaminase
MQDTYNVEIAGGLGASVGLVWRVGLLGFNANNANVAMVLESFRDGLEKQGKLGKL